MRYNNLEQILCAAIWYDDGKQYPQQEVYKIPSGFVICGFRHPNIIGVLPTNNIFRKQHNLIYSNTLFEITQGFITTKGRFVNREDASQIAVKSGQVEDSKTYNKRELFSEDIY